MPTFSEIYLAVFKLGLPVAAISFGMVWWALHRGVLSETDGSRALSREIDALGKKKDGEKPISVNPVHGKWLKFGGGFYGIVALYTYGLVEWSDVRETIAGFGGFGSFIGELNINLLINMIIEGLMNFITAVSWPVYWMSEFGAARFWVWGGIAYFGYYIGIRAAQNSFSRVE